MFVFRRWSRISVDRSSRTYTVVTWAVFVTGSDNFTFESEYVILLTEMLLRRQWFNIYMLRIKVITLRLVLGDGEQIWRIGARSLDKSV